MSYFLFCFLAWVYKRWECSCAISLRVVCVFSMSLINFAFSWAITWFLSSDSITLYNNVILSFHDHPAAQLWSETSELTLIRATSEINWHTWHESVKTFTSFEGAFFRPWGFQLWLHWCLLFRTVSHSLYSIPQQHPDTILSWTGWRDN